LSVSQTFPARRSLPDVRSARSPTRVAWPASSDVGVGLDEGAVYAADEHGALNAFSRNGGTSLWRNNQLANRSLSTPVASSAAVAVGDYQGYVHFFAKQDGLMLARIATDGSAILAAPLVTRGKFIFQTQAGTVVAIATE
jgi:outer membrane protein assembly factor BamB